MSKRAINTTGKDSLKGTIIKLKIICNNTRRGSTRRGVLLFKFKGSFNCTIPTPTSLPTTSEVTKVSKARPKVSTTLEEQSTTTNSPSKRTVVASSDSNQERRSGGKSSPLALIAGVTVAILVIVILIALLIYRHRHSLEKSNSGRESKEKRETVIRSLDEIRSDGPENEDHYRTLTLEDSAVYASAPVRNGEADQGNSRKNNDDERHLYAPLNISVGKNIYGHRNSQEIVAKDARPKINGPISVNQCVYDLMEDILKEPLKGPAEGDENSTEPVYNVLEGSCLDVSQSPALFGITSDSTEDLVYNYLDDGNDPIGNVLEGLSLNGAEESNHYAATGPMEPVYNTLEAPVDDNDGNPVYNVLEATEDEGGPRHQSAMFTIVPIYPNL
ncbi:uncharacterized protein LOC111340984 [Stylophora pistillata]|uniref:uncharacterized protein LOC111340984 n=1 Tax=Stylophora pistillata TaxID=50429 RepID=UPI000C04FD04|nr:uncharacterized protein LOC111340984 [Stylophora pistillata]